MNETILPKRFAEMRRESQSYHLIDVRTPMEFQEVHLTEARNIPLDRLRIEDIPQDGKPVLFICKSGTRGRMACEKFAGQRAMIFNVDGGTQACVEAGFTVVRGRKAMSVERQVRITAGSLILLGVILSFVHPAFLTISGFVGAGLVFSGVTDTCGMGMLLSKMPWNQTRKSGQACQA